VAAGIAFAGRGSVCHVLACCRKWAPAGTVKVRQGASLPGN